MCVLVSLLIPHTKQLFPIRPRCLSHRVLFSIICNLSNVFIIHFNTAWSFPHLNSINWDTHAYKMRTLKISNNILPRNASLLQFEWLILARWETSTKSNQEERKMLNIQWALSAERFPANTETYGRSCHWWNASEPPFWPSNQSESD